MAVSNEAILESGNQSFVFVKSDDHFVYKPITPGIVEDSYTEVLEGLKVGDEVVTQGNRELYTLWLTGGKASQDKHEGHH